MEVGVYLCQLVGESVDRVGRVLVVFCHGGWVSVVTLGELESIVRKATRQGVARDLEARHARCLWWYKMLPRSGGMFGVMDSIAGL